MRALRSVSLTMTCFCLFFQFAISTEKSQQLQFPLQFSATVLITANTIAETQQYPPRYRRMSVWYDYMQKVAKADVETGYEAAKTQLRRYDQRNEYMIRHDPINDCTRSYLGDTMPFPEMPKEGVTYVGVEVIEGNDGEPDVECNHWVHKEYNDIIHIFMHTSSGAPRRLVQEYTPEEGKVVTMLTYDYTNVKLGKQDIREFDLPEGYSHYKCDRHVGGFPYLHIFHYFVRF